MSMDRLRVERRVTRRAAVPAIIAVLAAAVLVTLLLSWSSARTDSVSFERQEQLVSRVLDESASKLAREQESLVFKDNMVRLLTNPIVTEADIQRLHNNLGPFVHRYYQHDETYVLTGDDRPTYAMRDGRIESPAAFESIRAEAVPVIEAVRTQTRGLRMGEPLSASPGAYDITVVNGRPAILSVKAVLSPTGQLPQRPGRELLQISVLRLDGRFLRNLAHNYLFEGARFSWSDDRSGSEASRAFVSPLTNRVVGHFIWQPYAPGSIVMGDMVPPLILTLLLIAAVVHFLLARIRKGTGQLIASEAHARHLAFHDVLTGLPNRALFNDRLDRALAVARRDPTRGVALLYVDLDRFKKVNDTLGHPAGDDLIREMSRRLAAVVRETDTVARLGGDEFAIVQTDVHSRDDIEGLCRRILAAAEKPFELVGSQVFVGMSIGVARGLQDAHDRMELTRKADIALYEAKSGGRGRYAVFDETMDATIQLRQATERDLKAAIASGTQLQVDYQPLYDARSKAVTGAEALVRWKHPTLGMLCPSVFIPIAEESGLIEPLGEWVLEQACQAARLWPISLICVNVSGVQLRNPAFAARVQRILRKTGLDPHRLELEITETSFVESVGECEDNLKVLRSMGVQIALDDFGTGYSSFNHLCSFEVDRIKIDRSFVNGIEGEEKESPIIQAIVDLARASGLKITAEGVETDLQSQYLQSVGCDELQGFFLSRPIPLNEVDRLFGIAPSRREQPLAA